jgi:hypothetical protein
MASWKARIPTRDRRGILTTGAVLLAFATLSSSGASARSNRHDKKHPTTTTTAPAATTTAPTRAPSTSASTSTSTTTMPISTTTAPRPTTTFAPATTTFAPATTTTVPKTTTTAAAPALVGGPLGVPGSWSSAFADEFNGTTLGRSKWNATGSWECCDGGRSNLPNGELDYKTDGQNFSFANGAITIQARRETAPNGQAWTSGQLGSTQAFTYGYVEQRGQFPSPKGFLDAFWTWGAPGTNASAQETDAYEFYSDNHGLAYLTAHTTGGGGCQGVALGFDPTAGMHVYGTDIEPTGTDWYIDGVHVCHAAGHPTQAWNIVDYMTVNAALRAPVADASTTHAEKIIDYIRVWTH